MPRKITHHSFKKEMEERYPNFTILDSIIFTGVKKPIAIQHNECGNIKEYKSAGQFQGKCRPCTLSGTPSSFKQKVEGTGEFELVDEFTGVTKPITIKHFSCGSLNYYKQARKFCFKCKTCDIGKTNLQKGKRSFAEKVVKLGFELIGDYYGAEKNVELIHSSCGTSIVVKPQSFIGHCQYCETLRLLSKKANKNRFEIVEYNGVKKPIVVKHLECGKIISLRFYNSFKGKCSWCSGVVSKSTEEFMKEVDDLSHGEYCVLGDYINAREKIKIKHYKCGHEYLVSPTSFIRGRRCPNCNNSSGEMEIANLLNELKIPFKTEFVFSDLLGVGGGNLRFDFRLLSQNKELLIEYDGEFHYHPINGEENLAKLQYHDKLKNDFCKKNKIKLIRIPYWKKDNIREVILKELIQEGFVAPPA